MNLANILFETVKKQPEIQAILGPGNEELCTYQQLGEQIKQVANALLNSGIRPNDSIGLHLPSGKDYIILTYAIWHCSACVVPIPVELAQQEKHEICNKICMNAIITKTNLKNLFKDFQLGSYSTITKDIIVFPIKCNSEHPFGFHQINAAFLRFTSGTTGNSKGVVLSHQTIYERINAANEFMKISPDDRVVWLLSMSYHFTVSIVSYLTFGAGIILCENHFGETILAAINRHAGTVIYGSPVHYELLSNIETSQEKSHLRLALATTAAPRTEVTEMFAHRFGIPLGQAYGIIEVGLPCICEGGTTARVGSVGRVLPAYEIQLRGAEYPEKTGNVEIRGPGFIDAYYSPWQTRSELLNDGWFTTGDMGYLDADGYLFLLGRSNDSINAGGMKFFPQEVEKVLESFPGIKESFVFAVPDLRLGESPIAHLVLNQNFKLTEQEVKDYCSRHLAAYKVPTKILFVDAIVKTASGKKIRRKIKNNLLEAPIHES